MCTYNYTYIHTYIHTYTHTYIDSYIHTYIHNTYIYHKLCAETASEEYVPRIILDVHSV